MSGVLLTLAWSTPMLMLAFVFSRFAGALIPLAVLPALISAMLVPVGSSVEIHWLLLGLTLHLDKVGATFLLFSAVMWLFAGIYGALTLRGDVHFGRFGVFFLLACAGNLLLILAADVVTFYVGFAIMGLAAAGLVAHRRSQQARRAARVYLAWTLVGEMALFTAVVLLVQGMDSLQFSDLTAQEVPDVAASLLLFGFGIKLALPGLHFWMPLTYRAAPAVAVAVLSGPMISAGLMGWLRFLPPGSQTLPVLGEGLLLFGIVGTSLGVLAGVVQRDPSTVLAYSSIAKMGMVSSAFGIALVRPDAAPGIVAALVVFTMHHLMLKGTLFLGIGEWRRNGAKPWLIVVFGILALAMAGVPFTSGAGAKLMMSEALINTGFDLALLLGFSTAGTLFLLARFIWLIMQRPATATAVFDWASLTWMALATLAVLLPLVRTVAPWSASGLGVIAGAMSIAVAILLSRHFVSFRLPPVPPGDLLYLWRASQRLRARQIDLHDLTLSPRTLLLADELPTAVRTVGALIWLLAFVAIVSIGILPG